MTMLDLPDCDQSVPVYLEFLSILNGAVVAVANNPKKQIENMPRTPYTKTGE